MSPPPSPCIMKSPSPFVVAVTVTKLCIVRVLVDSVSEKRQLLQNDNEGRSFATAHTVGSPHNTCAHESRDGAS